MEAGGGVPWEGVVGHSMGAREVQVFPGLHLRRWGPEAAEGDMAALTLQAVQRRREIGF